MSQPPPSNLRSTEEEEEGRILLPFAKPRADAGPRSSTALALRTPGGGGVYLKLPLRVPRTAVLQQPLASAIARTVGTNRLSSQQPLGGDRPIPPLPAAHSVPGRRVTGGDIILSQQSSYMSQLTGFGEEGASANLSLLSGTDYLFLRKCSTFPAGLEAFHRLIIKREVVNSSGRCIYYCGQLLNRWQCCFRYEFTYHVFDRTGRTVVLTKGTQLILGITASATVFESDGGILGTLTQDICDAAYVIKDREGRPLFAIRGPCYGACTPCVFWCFDEHFEVNAEDDVTEVGLISTHWKKVHPDQDSRWGLNFPIALEPRHKALLLGAAFLIHFQYHRRGGNGVVVFLLFCLLLGALIAVWYGLGFIEHKTLDIGEKP